MDAAQVLENVVLLTAKTHNAQLKAPAACCALFSESEFPVSVQKQSSQCKDAIWSRSQCLFSDNESN